MVATAKLFIVEEELEEELVLGPVMEAQQQLQPAAAVALDLASELAHKRGAAVLVVWLAVVMLLQQASHGEVELW